MKITSWQRFDKKEQKWLHNHISNGWVTGIPTPQSDEQQVWLKMKWRFFHKRLINHKVI